MTRKNYDTYRFTIMDWLMCILQAGAFTTVIGYLFYDSIKAAVLILPVGIGQYRSIRRQKILEQKKRLSVQFKSLMEGLVTSLTAGYSLERAFREAKKDLALLYPETAEIFGELEWILSGLDRNMPIEELLYDFGGRSGIEDIANFANVIRAAKKNGGNLIHIIQKTVHSIADKMTVEEDIATMIAAKRLEQKIMLVMPYGILGYLKLTNGEFLTVLYHNGIGVCLMTAFLAGIYLAGIWAERIMDIRI